METEAGPQGREVVVVHGRPTAEEVVALVVSLRALVARGGSPAGATRARSWHRPPAVADRWRLSTRTSGTLSPVTAVWGG